MVDEWLGRRWYRWGCCSRGGGRRWGCLGARLYRRCRGRRRGGVVGVLYGAGDYSPNCLFVCRWGVRLRLLGWLLLFLFFPQFVVLRLKKGVLPGSFNCLSPSFSMNGRRCSVTGTSAIAVAKPSSCSSVLAGAIVWAAESKQAYRKRKMKDNWSKTILIEKRNRWNACIITVTGLVQSLDRTGSLMTSKFSVFWNFDMWNILKWVP